MLKDVYFESVRLGHPDKMCDFISDSILDAFISKDKDSRVACECFFAGRNLVIGGEISSTATVDIIQVAKDCIKTVGYSPEYFSIQNLVSKQSPEIANLVASSEELGAGDQGVVVGYACRDEKNITREFKFIQHLMKVIDDSFRVLPELTGMMPDGKGFISSLLEETRVHVSYEAKDDGNKEVRQKMLEKLVRDLYKEYGLGNQEDLKVTFIEYHLGGPLADTGLTGRKIIVDTYGGVAQHGGGAYSGKDGTKVDRTGSYLARQLAVSIVKKTNCESATVWLGYAIGESRPVSIKLDVKGYCGSVVDLEDALSKKVLEKDFALNKLIEGYYGNPEFKGFNSLSAYGHFGKGNAWDLPIEF